MRLLPFALVAALAIPLFAAAAPPGPTAAARAHQAAAARAPALGGPHALGKFEDWTAATHQESGQTVCYAFTVAQASTPALMGRERVVLTVTERPSGRDSVAIAAGFPFATGAEASLIVDQAAFAFYTSQRSAFARDGMAVVAAMQRGRQAQARSPGPRGGAAVVDTFSLRGFHDAYAAVQKACPAK